MKVLHGTNKMILLFLVLQAMEQKNLKCIFYHTTLDDSVILSQ